MGWGDEILALGRAERYHEATGDPVSIRAKDGKARDNILWHGNPAWSKDAKESIIDGPGARPYLLGFTADSRGDPVAHFNLKHRARAGRIHLTLAERDSVTIREPFAVISPHVKDNASRNKQWGVDRWQQVIEGFPIPVYQLGPPTSIIAGAQHYHTPTMRDAAAVIDRAAVVLTNEGGTHHLAAAMQRPAVVIFGAFIPPSVTGYDFHANMAVETDEGYCGRWGECEHCKLAMAQITPAMVKERAMQILGA